MFKDFSKFKFDVIDVSVQGTPHLLININGLTFSKRVLEDMGYPSHIRPLIDVENKAFAVQACKQTDERAVKFSKPRGEQLNTVSFTVNSIYRTIRTTMRGTWNDDNRYDIAGIYYPDAKAMVFDLNSAEELPPLRPLKRKRKDSQAG